MCKKIFNWLSRNECYVIADPRDNSITFSKGLCKIMNLDQLKEAKVFAFEVKDKGKMSTFGFCLNPELGQETQLADIMYNDKYKCVGFECLSPTVNRIFYAYDIRKYESPCKLTVRQRKANELVFYEICPPQGNK